MYKSTLVNASTDILNKYKTYRNTLQKVIRYSKHHYYLNKCIEYKNNSRKLWNLINSKITKCNNKTESIEKIKVENIYKYDPKSITNTLCKHFSTIGKNYAERVPKSSININDYIAKITNNNNSLFLTPTTEQEVSSLITPLPNKTSSGYNNINNLILKEIKQNITKPLTLLINRSLLEGKFPQAMKLADVCPLFKCKDRTDPNNYRPISLLMTLSKLLEKIIYTRVYNFLIETKQIYNSQYGFRSGHNCEHAVSELISAVLKGLQQKEYTLGVFLDLSKAFDTLDHQILLNKLSRYGIRGTALNWFASYLSNREIRVKCSVASTGKVEYSDYEPVHYGTPQGSCLGPLIYLIFTNDLAIHLEHCNTIMFADDTTLYQTHKSIRYLKWCLQEDIKSLSDWFRANKLTLNLDKTACVLFKKNGDKTEIKLTLDNNHITSVKETKFLGMWLDCYLNWNIHLTNLFVKLKRNQSMLRLSKHFLDEQSRKLVYYSHLESHINYGLLIWGNNVSNEQINKLQRIQTECLKLIAHRNKRGNLNKELGILPIKSKITLENYKFGYKLKNKQLLKKTITLCYFDSNNKSLIKEHKYQTRHKTLPNLPKNANKTYITSFLCMGPKAYQTLPIETQLKTNFRNFITSCKHYLFSHLT